MKINFCIMKFKVIAIVAFLLFNGKDTKGQSSTGVDSNLLFVDSSFITQMCIGKSLSYYRKIFSTNYNSLLKLKVYDFKNILIVEGFLSRNKRGKYQPHGQWHFYTDSGTLRKTGTFEKSYKVDYWIDYDADHKEVYKSYYRKENRINYEQIAILDAGPSLEIYFDIRDLIAVPKGNKWNEH